MRLYGSLLGSLPVLQAVLLLVLLLGCGGIAIGDPGEDGEEAAHCAPDGDVEVTDPSAPLEGFDKTPEEQVAEAETRLTGMLDLADGPSLPVELTLAVSGVVRVISTTDPDPDCKPYLLAEATLEIDAGASLRGVARGELYIREPLQFRGDWTPLEDFETTLEPKFDAEIVEGPALIAYLLRDEDEPWMGELDFAAQVETKPCDQATQMCTGGPGNFTPEYHPLGKLKQLEPIP